MVVAWQPVESSNIDQIGFDLEAEELHVRFNHGTVYVYKNVPGSVFADFIDADSKGRFLNTNIKGQYEYVRA